MAGRDGFDLSRYEAELLDDMVGTMVEQVEAMEDLWDDIIDIVHRYPVDINNDTLVMEWSGIITSTRRIVNRVLTTSDQYIILDPGVLDLDLSDDFFSAREHGGDDDYDDNSAVEGDDHDIDGVDHAARIADNVEPDATFKTLSDEAEQELKEVEQQQVDLGCEALVENLKHQWDHDSVMSIARQYVYIQMNHISNFIHCHRSAEVTRDELTQLKDMERSLIQ